MEDTELALVEIERLQVIICRHEQHVFWTRTTLLASLAGLLTGYYTENVVVSPAILCCGAVLLIAAFLFLELFHKRLISAVIKRGSNVEEQIRRNRSNPSGWYDGPFISESCQNAGKTCSIWQEFRIAYSAPFYAFLGIALAGVMLALPPKQGKGSPVGGGTTPPTAATTKGGTVPPGAGQAGTPTP